MITMELRTHSRKEYSYDTRAVSTSVIMQHPFDIDWNWAECDKSAELVTG